MLPEEIQKAAEKMDGGEIELPLVNLTVADVYEALYIHCSYKETFKDSILKLQTWIINFAEESVAPLREAGDFTEKEIEEIKGKQCVISPMTLTLYVHWLQMENFIKMPDSEKERVLLEKMPDRFKARFRGNAACRQARETTAEEDASKEAVLSAGNDAEKNEQIRHQSFIEFLRDFGEAIRKEQQMQNKGA